MSTCVAKNNSNVLYSPSIKEEPVSSTRLLRSAVLWGHSLRQIIMVISHQEKYLYDNLVSIIRGIVLWVDDCSSPLLDFHIAYNTLPLRVPLSCLLSGLCNLHLQFLSHVNLFPSYDCFLLSERCTCFKSALTAHRQLCPSVSVSVDFRRATYGSFVAKTPQTCKPKQNFLQLRPFTGL